MVPSCCKEEKSTGRETRKRKEANRQGWAGIPSSNWGKESKGWEGKTNGREQGGAKEPSPASRPFQLETAEFPQSGTPEPKAE